MGWHPHLRWACTYPRPALDVTDGHRSGPAASMATQSSQLHLLYFILLLSHARHYATFFARPN